MEVKEALKLQTGNWVWLQYTASPGHGPSVNSPAMVRRVPTSVESGKDYVFIEMKPAGWLHYACWSSKFITHKL